MASLCPLLKMEGNHMPNEKELVAYCGLYCGECYNYTGKIADLARDIRKELRSFRFDKSAEALSELSFFNVFKDYDKCYQVLGAMVKLRCRSGCRAGGGNPYCKIRNCCQKKGCIEERNPKIQPRTHDHNRIHRQQEYTILTKQKYKKSQKRNINKKQNILAYIYQFVRKIGNKIVMGNGKKVYNKQNETG